MITFVCDVGSPEAVLPPFETDVIGPFSEKSIGVALAVTMSGSAVGVAGGVHVSYHGIGSSAAFASSSLAATSSSSDIIP